MFSLDPNSTGILDRHTNSQKFKRMDDCLDPYYTGILDGKACSRVIKVLILILLE